MCVHRTPTTCAQTHKYERLTQSLNLPAILDVLEKPISLPPSLLAKAREIREHNSPSLIEQSLEVIEEMSSQNSSILDEVILHAFHSKHTKLSHIESQAIEILDQEAEEDGNFRGDHELKRPQSHEANLDLIAKHTRYLKVLEQASESDKQVWDKWYEWKENIEQLCWDEV